MTLVSSSLECWLNAGDLRTVSGDLKTPFRQSKGILRHTSDDSVATHEANLPRSAPKGDVTAAPRSGGMSRSGSLQRVVSFEDEKLQDPLSRAGSLRSGSSGEGRSAGLRNDLFTVREVPSSGRRHPEEESREPRSAGQTGSHSRQQTTGGRTPVPRGFVRQASQEPRFRIHTEPVRPASNAAATRPALRAEEREIPGRQASAFRGEHHSMARTRSGRSEGRRNLHPSPRGPLDEREDKWEKEAARLKLLEQHMRSAITPRSRDKAEPSARNPTEAPRQGQGRNASKPSLEEMLVLIEDARKLYSPGSETRQKLDQ